MPVEVDVTDGPARSTTAGGANQMQPLIDAVDVSTIDSADLLLVILGNAFSVSGTEHVVTLSLNADPVFYYTDGPLTFKVPK